MPDLRGFLPMGGGVGRPNLSPVAQAPGYRPPPSRLAQFISQPGLRDALLSFGPAMLAASSQPGATLGGALGRAVPHGVQAFRGGQQRAALDELLENAPPGMANLIRSLPLEQQAMAMFTLMSRRPDISHAPPGSAILTDGEVTGTVPAEPADRKIVESNDGFLHAIDPQTGVGERVTDPDGNPIRADQAGRLGAPTEYKDPVTGKTKLGAWDADAGRFVDVPGAEPIPAAGSEGERKAAAFLEVAPDAVEFVDSFEGAPGRIEQALSDTGIREFTDAEMQQLQLAGATLAEAWLRMTTGAAYNEQEFQNAFLLFVPRPGDKKEALDMKRKNRARLLRMLEKSAGRLAGQESSESDPLGIRR